MKLPSFITGIFSPGPNSPYATGINNSSSKKPAINQSSLKTLASHPNQSKGSQNPTPSSLKQLSSNASKCFDALVNGGIGCINALIDNALLAPESITRKVASGVIELALKPFKSSPPQ